MKTELGDRVHKMGRSLEGDRWQDGGDQRSLGGIWDEGAGEVIGRSWERVLDAESIRGWGNCWKYPNSVSTKGLMRESRDY